MARISDDLPGHFPIGTKYVVESHGSVVHRFVELPDGRRINLPNRKALTCTQAARRRDRQSTRDRQLTEGLKPRLGL
jgi:hypothetical protein